MVERKRTRNGRNGERKQKHTPNVDGEQIPQIEHRPIRHEEQAARKAEPSAQRGSQLGQRYLAIAIIVLLAAAVVYLVLFQLPSLSGASFSSFKNNFDNAPRVAVTVIYHNNTQWPLEEPCFTRLIDILSGVRGASTIDFFLVNQTSCTYSPTGLGHSANYITKSAGACLATAQNEPGIYLNYSSTYNRTTITPTHLYINANESYYNACPIAAEFA